jgi:S-DNA-T family DNA segregation ATPase FtsK/SpoIIIE
MAAGTSVVRSIAFSPDGTLLAWCGWRGLKIWDLQRRSELHSRRGHTGTVCIAFSSVGTTLASGGADGWVMLWDAVRGEQLHAARGHQGSVLCLAFSPDGTSLASGGADGTLRLWNTATGKELRTLSGHGVPVLSLAFSLDGKMLASGGADAAVMLWESTEGQQLRTLRGHQRSVGAVAFSPAGGILASGGRDQTVRLWQVDTGQERSAISTAGIGMVHSLGFSRDGRHLAVGGDRVVGLFEASWHRQLPALVAPLMQAASEGQFWCERIRQKLASDDTQAAEKQARAQYQQWITNFSSEPHVAIVPWMDPLWKGWATESQQCIAPAIRLGKLQARLPDGQPACFPALLGFIGDRPLLVEASGQAKSQAVGAIQSLLIRLLASVSPGSLRFTFLDPVGLGGNVAPFMQLADYDEALVTSRAWTEPQHIEQRLAELTEHMEDVIQKYLRNQYAAIEEYNEQAGEVAEPYRVLVALDFPINFSEAAARRLVSIAQNGPRCGVYAIILVDTEKPMPYGFNLADLEQNATVIAWNDERFVWEDDDFRDCLLELDTLPDAALVDRILKGVGEAVKDAGRVEVPFERVAPPQERWWKGGSGDELRVPLGPSGARRVQELELGQGTAHHVLVAGRVGSGKSTLLHTLITNLALLYSPSEVELYLIDFKKGVEFKTYATHQLPHARVIAIESVREFGLSVVQGLDAELKRRGDLFRAAGVDHIADYRRRTGQPMPRILLLVDEFQEFFIEDDAIATQAAQILDRLVRQGRAFGVHVLLGSQTLAGAYNLARATIDQMAVRIALQCSEADSRLILADDNAAARRLTRPGEAIYNAANGMVEGNSPFQVAWLPDEQRDRYLEQVRALAEQHEYRPSQPQIVFEGNAPAEVEKNRQLNDLLAATGRPAPSRSLRAWLGEPIAIREPLAAVFRRQSGSNLLIVGQYDETALGMLATGLISLAAQLPVSADANGTDSRDHFYVLDFGAVDAPDADLFSGLAGLLPHPLKIGRRRQLPEMIGELADEVQRRIDADEMSAPPKYLFVYGLQRSRDLRQEESFAMPSFGEEPKPPSPAEQFATILREGPEVGIHTVVWCDTLTNLNRTLDRRALREFAMRVVFQMSAEDSANLVDTPAGSKLGPYRALFYGEDEGRLEKFRSYALPSDAWLAWVSKRLQDR